MAALEQALTAAAWPLLTASRKGDDQAVAQLLADGAEPNSPDELDKGYSPLHAAAQKGHARAMMRCSGPSGRSCR